MIQLYNTALARSTNFPYSSVSPSRTQPGPPRHAVNPPRHAVGKYTVVLASVADPEPNLDPDLDPLVKRFGSGSFYHEAKILRITLIPTIL